MLEADKPKKATIIDRLKGLFAKQKKAVADTVKAGLPSQFVDLADWNSDFADEIMPVIELFYERGAGQLIRQIGASPDLFAVVTPNIRQAVQAAALKFAKSTNETTSLQINDAIAKLRTELEAGLTAGDTRTMLRDRVNEIFDQATQSRAQMIADSEASRALHGGQTIAAKESGAIKGKRWLLSDDACLEICQPIAAAQPAEGIPLDANFVSGDGPYGDVPYPPAHPSCQCSLEYVLSDEYDQAIGEQ